MSLADDVRVHISQWALLTGSIIPLLYHTHESFVVHAAGQIQSECDGCSVGTCSFNVHLYDGTKYPDRNRITPVRQRLRYPSRIPRRLHGDVSKRERGARGELVIQQTLYTPFLRGEVRRTCEGTG